MTENYTAASFGWYTVGEYRDILKTTGLTEEEINTRLEELGLAKLKPNQSFRFNDAQRAKEDHDEDT